MVKILQARNTDCQKSSPSCQWTRKRQPSETETMTITTLLQVNTTENPQHLPIPMNRIPVDKLELQPRPEVTTCTSPSLLGQMCSRDRHPTQWWRGASLWPTPLHCGASGENKGDLDIHLQTWQGNEAFLPVPAEAVPKEVKRKFGLWHYPVVRGWPSSTPFLQCQWSLSGERGLLHCPVITRWASPHPKVVPMEVAWEA